MTTPVDYAAFQRRQQDTPHLVPPNPSSDGGAASVFTGVGQFLHDSSALLFAASQYNRGGYGFFGGGGCGFDPMAGIYAMDAAQRNFMMNAAMTAPTGTGGGGSTPTTDADGNEIVTTNKNEVFNKLDAATLQELKDIERQIKEAEEAMRQATTDADKRPHAERLRTLKSRYREVERRLATNGQVPSSILGKTDFTLYTNLSEDELAQIKDWNSQIQQLKADADQIKKDLDAKKDAATRKIQQALAQGKTEDSALTQEEKDAIKALEESYAAKLKDVSDKIKELDSAVRRAVENGDSIDFEVHTQTEASRAGDQARAQGTQQIGQKIADALFKDGKVATKQELKDAIKDITSNYDQATIDAMCDLFATQAAGCTKEQFIEKMKTQGFIDAAISKLGNGTDNASKAKASLFVKITDSLCGAGQYAQTLNGLSGGLQSAAQNLKGIMNAGASWTPPQSNTPTSTPRQNTPQANAPSSYRITDRQFTTVPTSQLSEEALNNKYQEYQNRHKDRNGNINWNTVRDAIICDYTISTKDKEALLQKIFDEKRLNITPAELADLKLEAQLYEFILNDMARTDKTNNEPDKVHHIAVENQIRTSNLPPTVKTALTNKLKGLTTLRGGLEFHSSRSASNSPAGQASGNSSGAGQVDVSQHIEQINLKSFTFEKLNYLSIKMDSLTDEQFIEILSNIDLGSIPNTDASKKIAQKIFARLNEIADNKTNFSMRAMINYEWLNEIELRHDGYKDDVQEEVTTNDGLYEYFSSAANNIGNWHELIKQFAIEIKRCQ